MRIILNQTKKEKQCSVIISFNVYPIMLRCVALRCVALRSVAIYLSIYLSRRMVARAATTAAKAAKRRSASLQEVIPKVKKGEAFACYGSWLYVFRGTKYPQG